MQAWRAYRAGRIGDAGAYKAAALGAPAYPDVERQLRALPDPFPRIDLDALRREAPGTFAHAYVAFMDVNGLEPLVVSGEAASEVAEANTLAVRYPILHDAFHVILGFDATWPGELGVWSFVSAQHYSPTHDRAATMGRFLYPFFAPSQLGALRQARLRGKELAQRMPCLIAQPLEQWWGDPLEAVRERLIGGRG